MFLSIPGWMVLLMLLDWLLKLLLNEVENMVFQMNLFERGFVYEMRDRYLQKYIFIPWMYGVRSSSKKSSINSFPQFLAYC